MARLRARRKARVVAHPIAEYGHGIGVQLGDQNRAFLAHGLRLHEHVRPVHREDRATARIELMGHEPHIAAAVLLEHRRGERGFDARAMVREQFFGARDDRTRGVWPAIRSFGVDCSRKRIERGGVGHDQLRLERLQLPVEAAQRGIINAKDVEPALLKEQVLHTFASRCAGNRIEIVSPHERRAWRAREADAGAKVRRGTLRPAELLRALEQFCGHAGGAAGSDHARRGARIAVASLGKELGERFALERWQPQAPRR
jgi:hypothetical protein